jgi:rod shape determining protein RodA
MNSLSSTAKRSSSLGVSIILPLLILSTMGILTLLSTTILPKGGFGNLEIVYKQILFVILGFILFFLVSRVDLSYIKHWQSIFIIYIPTLILLVVTLLFAPTINFVKRWLVIGGVQIQPSEIAKLVVIIYTAVLMSKKDSFNEWLLFGISFLLTIPFVVLIYLEPDASMSLLILLIWFFVAFMGLTNPLRNTAVLLVLSFVLGGFLLGTITGSLAWYLLIIPGVIITIFVFYSQNSWRQAVVISLIVGVFIGLLTSVIWQGLLQDYQKDRIVAFLNPSETESDIGFNVNQARIAIGSGQLLGKGFGNGTQSKRDFLPEHQTDFIFASFAEEFGLVGSLFLIGLYGYLIVRCFLIAMDTSKDQFFSLLVLGVGIKLLFEVFINLGTNTGTIPATGIPLPLMSAGGSITIMTLLAFGLVQNVKRENDTMKANVMLEE